MRRFKTGFILGAGLGTRLRPLTETCPKPLLPLHGRPVITYAMDQLIEAGVDRFIVNTHHCAEVYREKFPDSRWRDIPITFRHEPVLLDTAGGLKNIEDLLDDDETILCYNSDVFTDLPLLRLIECHRARAAEVTLLLRSVGPQLHVTITESGEVCDIRNRTGIPGAKNCLFTGIYAVEKSLLKYIEPGRIETIITTFIERIVEKPGSVIGIVIDEGEWHDIGTLEAYESLNARTDALEE